MARHCPRAKWGDPGQVSYFSSYEVVATPDPGLKLEAGCPCDMGGATPLPQSKRMKKMAVCVFV